MLFDRVGTDPIYERLRTAAHPLSQAVQQFYEERWLEFEPFAEIGFQDNLARTFEHRSWELELGASLARRNLLHARQAGQGPDFQVYWGEGLAFVEATCPAAGHADNPDRVPDIPWVELDEGRFRVFDVAEEQSVLRCTAGIAEKVRQYRAFKATPAGRNIEDSGLVVALSGRAIREHAGVGPFPLPLRFLYGAGHLEVDFDPATREVMRQRLAHQPYRFRAGGAEIDTSLFITGQYPELLAVLWDPGFGDVQNRWEDQWVMFPRPGEALPSSMNWLRQVTVDETGAVRGLI